MEAIKISVEVSVNLSENTQNFIKSLFTTSQCESSKPVASAPVASAPSKPAAAPAPSKPATPSKPVTAPAPSKPAVPSTPASKSIEDVRKMLAQKVNEHRDVIKQKLNELGAPSVTKLDPAKYDEMYNFLTEL